MTQKNYFDGAYLGCDVETGLGLPVLRLIAEAYKLPFTLMSDLETLDKDIQEVCERVGPELIEVRIDPEQTYYPKITSRVLENGLMESNPLPLMTPELEHDVSLDLFKFLSLGGSSNE
jgi:acetolactate synthase-1/2/3 large subunit